MIIKLVGSLLLVVLLLTLVGLFVLSQSSDPESLSFRESYFKFATLSSDEKADELISGILYPVPEIVRDLNG